MHEEDYTAGSTARWRFALVLLTAALVKQH